MFNKKTLISSMVLERFIDNYSENEYQSAWEKLQTFLTENKDNPDLYRESAFDAEWLNEVFCDILGYPKKLKSREYWTTNGAGKKEERVDGVFYHQDGKHVRIVVELKALDTPDLFKKDGKLSPITQGAKYLFQTPSSELAVVSNFNNIVVFDRKEEFRQSWAFFTMSFEEFKELYLVLSYNSVYGNLTKLMIDQSEKSEKDVDDDFYALAASIHRSLHNKMTSSSASDLFNKFLALAILEDSGKLPTQLINTVYNRKTDFDQSLKSHWAVFITFFQTMKNNKSSREYLNISEEVSALQVWQDVSYLGRVSVPKSILDQVVALSEYNLKSVPIDQLFFNIAKRIYNPYDGVSFMSDEDMTPFEFYSYIFKKGQYSAIDVCMSFAAGTSANVNHPLVQLYNQLSTTKITQCSTNTPFTINPDYVGDASWFGVIPYIDLEEEATVKSVLRYLFTVSKIVIGDEDYAILGFMQNPEELITIDDGEDMNVINRTLVRTRLHVLTDEEKDWVSNYLSAATPFTKFGRVVTSPEAAWFRLNLSTGGIVEKDEFGDWPEIEELYESNEIKVLIASEYENLPLILSSNDFIKYLKLADIIDLKHAAVSNRLLTPEFLTEAKNRRQLNETIMLYEYNLDKLKMNGADELEILKIDKKLDDLYIKQRKISETLV
jgi:hypothetical protein